jgi:hypothetical protein
LPPDKEVKPAPSALLSLLDVASSVVNYAHRAILGMRTIGNASYPKIGVKDVGSVTAIRHPIIND